MGDTSARASELFLRACHVRDPEARRALIDRECAGDADLRGSVEALLRSYERRSGGAPQGAPASDAPLPAPPPPSAPAAPLPPPGTGQDERVGGLLAGKYKLIEVIGEGGMGSVFMAQQQAPVRRLVAVKVIKAGMDSKEVLARFDAERQAMAMMDHPNIARALDAGSTQGGSPFFVMELVRGVPITKFCDDHKLPPRVRMELFVQVCQGIQHAHQKGIIHRDIKPSNVLVALYDDRPVPKVIDFGVAKAAGQPLTDRTLMTGFGAIVGTPEYMSPEQATLNQLDVDTRSDVYSLGVLLYELLTGTTPLARGATEGGALLEVLRIIREEEPQRPSTRVGTSNTRREIAASRATEPERLHHLLKGELDWILLKALEKSRARRYESANALAADVQRYLAGEPVEAVPPSAGYRLRKTLRRHKGKTTAAAMTAGALVAGLVAFAWQANVAGAQRDRALKAEADAKARASELALVAEFQAGMLEQIDVTEAGRALAADVAARFRDACAKAGLPPDAQEAEIRAFRSGWGRVNATDAARELIDRTILRPAIATIDGKFKDQPLVDAQLRQVLADRYAGLTLYAEAAPLQARALEIRTRLLGADDPLTLASMTSAADLLHMQGRIAEAEAMFRDALARRIRVHGDDAKETTDSRYALAEMLATSGRSREAEETLRAVVAWRERNLGERDRATLAAMVILGGAVERQDRLDEAKAIFEVALARATAAFGPDDRVTAECLGSIAVLEQRSGHLVASENRFRELLAHHRRVYGEDHHFTLIILGNLGFVLREQGRYAEAHPVIRDSYDRRRRTLGEENPSTLWSLHDLGDSFLEQGRLDEALDCYRRAWEGRREAYGDANELSLLSIEKYALVLRMLGRNAESAAAAQAALERCRAPDAKGSSSTRRARCQLAWVLVETHPAEAEAVFRAVVEEGLRDEGPGSFPVVRATSGLALATAMRGDVDGAMRVLRDALAARRGSPAKELVPLADGLVRVSELLGPRDAAKREELLREALRIRRAGQGDGNAETLDTINRLGAALQRMGRQPEAEPLLREAYETRLRSQGPEHWATLTSLRNMWIVLKDLGRAAEAEPLCREDLERLRNWKGPLDADWRWALGSVTSGLSEILSAQGRTADAVQEVRLTIERLRREAGDDDVSTVTAVVTLARLLQWLPQLDEAEDLARGAVRRAERLPAGPDSPLAHEARMCLGGILWSQKKYDQSLPLFEAEHERMRAAYGPTHLLTFQSAANLAINYRDTGRVAEAADLYQATMEGARKAGHEADMMESGHFEPYLDTLKAAGRRDDMVRALCDATELARRRAPDPGLARAAATLSYIGLLLDLEAWTEAEPYLREAIALREASGPDLWSLFNARALLGELLLRRGRFAEAEPLVVGGYEGVIARRSQVPPQGQHWIEKGADRILRLYAAWDAAEPGTGRDRELEEWKARLAAGAPAAR